MKDKNIILDLCGGTSAWSEPYKKAGFRIVNITLPEYDVNQFDAMENEIRFYRKSGYLGINFNEIYGILAAPPCQMFSLARTRAKKPRNLKEGMKVVKACLNVIWEVRYKTKLNFWALENPMGYLRQFLGVPKFTFHPWEFGENYSKRTDIWGYFNEPKKKIRILTEEEKDLCRRNARKLLSLGDTQDARRAITPKGFAEAFFRGNSKL